MDLTKREKTGLVGFIIVILIITSFFYFRDKAMSSIEVIKDTNTSDSMDKTSDGYNNEKANVPDKNTNTNFSIKSNQIYVYITGEINNPGVYILNEGDRVEKLITKAGGLTPKADTLSINLASKLKDEDHIEVYSKGVVGSAEVINGNTVNPQLNSNNKEAKININVADKEQLKELPRIGDALSQRIIDYRTQNGKFNDIKDITNVSGIGSKLYDSIKDKISIQ